MNGNYIRELLIALSTASIATLSVLLPLQLTASNNSKNPTAVDSSSLPECTGNGLQLKRTHPVLYSNALELDLLIRMQETRQGRNMGYKPERDWGEWHIHYRTGLPQLLRYLYYVTTQSKDMGFYQKLETNILYSHENYRMGRGRFAWRTEVVDTYALSWMYIQIMIDKQSKCARFRKEAWSCFHSATDKFRRHYVWSVMRFMTTEQVGKFINLDDYEF